MIFFQMVMVMACDKTDNKILHLKCSLSSVESFARFLSGYFVLNSRVCVPLFSRKKGAEPIFSLYVCFVCDLSHFFVILCMSMIWTPNSETVKKWINSQRELQFLYEWPFATFSTHSMTTHVAINLSFYFSCDEQKQMELLQNKSQKHDEFRDPPLTKQVGVENWYYKFTCFMCLVNWKT